MPLVDDHLHGPLAEVIRLFRTWERLLCDAEGRIADLEAQLAQRPPPEPPPQYWRAERDELYREIAILGAHNRRLHALAYPSPGEGE